jgi:hypothetical protein
MPGWAKVAVLVCLICASGWANTDGSQTTSAMAESSAGSWFPTSCFWFKGERKWCLGSGWEHCEEEISIWTDGDGRYDVENQKGEVLGYVQPTGPGRWRAMVNTYEGWARAGRVVRASRGRYLIFSGGRRRGFARGPAAVAVAAYRLVAGDCVTSMTHARSRRVSANIERAGS